jgi:hypothetical protein
METKEIGALLAKADRYANAHGNGFMRVLVSCAAGNTTRAEALAAVGAFQLADGGWWGIGMLKAPLSTVTNTINGLMWLCFLDGSASPSAEQAVAFLRQRQRDDGSWDEVEEINQHGPQIWMVPGSYANQVWYTVAICRYLMELGRENEVDFAAALDFVRHGWDGGQFPQYIHPHWMGLYVFNRTVDGNSLDSQIAAGCLARLLNFAAVPQLNAGELGEVGYAALGAGQPAAGLLANVSQRLMAGQAQEGYWDFDEGDTEDRVMNTAKVAGFFRALDGGSGLAFGSEPGVSK